MLAVRDTRHQADAIAEMGDAVAPVDGGPEERPGLLLRLAEPADCCA